MLDSALRDAQSAISAALDSYRPQLGSVEIGRVLSIEKGVARVSGLAGVKSMELVHFENGGAGMAFNLDPGHVGVVVLNSGSGLSAGAEVLRSGKVVSTPVGEGLLGRVVDALGWPLDERGPIPAESESPVEREAPPIIARKPVTRPLETGVKVIDSLIPIGRGQRQLILGDRQTGKTAITLDTLLNQGDSGVISIYCAIAARSAAVARVVNVLRTRGALERCVVVVAEGDEPPGLQFIAPYAATSIAEYFMEQGRDVLIIYDDLTRHAYAYRELSLLLRRPPGREAYPGDIFYIHSRLLERSTSLRESFGGGSLTALPIIETQAQNISAYIPTNLISITDGQIYVSPEYFQKGILPAIDVGKSVSRVGGKAQLPAFASVSGELRLAYTQFQELEAFSRFGTRLDEATKRAIERGRRIRELLKQSETQAQNACEQIMSLLALNQGLFDKIPIDQVAKADSTLRAGVRHAQKMLCKRIYAGDMLGDSERKQVLKFAGNILRGYRAKTE